MPNKRNSRRNPKRRTNVSSARKSEQPNAEAFGLTRKTSGPALNLTAIIVSFPEFCPRATNYPRARAKLRRSLRKACEIRAKCRRRSSGVHPRQNPRLYKFLSETGVAPASTSAQQWPPVKFRALSERPFPRSYVRTSLRYFMHYSARSGGGLPGR